jgi:hypothetical protein
MMELVWMTVAGVIAFTKGRGLFRWVLAAYVLGWIAPAILMFLSVKVDKLNKRKELFTEAVEEHVVKQEFKDVNNVDDLFNQLEKPKG